MTESERTQQAEIQRLIDSPKTPADLKEQLKNHPLDEVIKYYEDLNYKQIEETDIYEGTHSWIRDLIAATRGFV